MPAYPNSLMYGRTIDGENVPILVDADGKIVTSDTEGITGTLTSGQVPYATGANTVGSDANLTYNHTNVNLGLINGIAGFGLTFNPSNANWVGAILVNTGDIGALGGNAYVVRIYDQIAGQQTFDLDAWGGIAVNESAAGGSESATWAWQDAGARTYAKISSKSILFWAGSGGSVLLKSPNQANSITFNDTQISVTGDSVSTGSVTATDFIVGNGSAFKTDTTDAHTGLIQAYDVDGAAYVTFGTLTNGNTPSFALAAPAGGTLTGNFTSLKVGGVDLILTGTTSSIGGSLLVGVGSTATGTATVAGAVVGQPVAVSASDGTAPNALISLSASVTSANTVTVQLTALAAVTPTSKTYNVAVLL